MVTVKFTVILERILCNANSSSSSSPMSSPFASRKQSSIVKWPDLLLDLKAACLQLKSTRGFLTNELDKLHLSIFAALKEVIGAHVTHS